MSILNSSLSFLLPLFPKWVARPFAAPYVAGETLSEAVKIVAGLNASGFQVTMDILGEHVHSVAEAKEVTKAYLDLYDCIAREKIASTVSLKLTHLGLEIDPQVAEKNLLTILDKAQEYGNFLRIDMENSPYTDKTLALYRKCRQRYAGVGTVLQAYLHRTLKDISLLNDPGFNCRICKGIYREPETIAFQDKNEINRNYIEAVKDLLDGGSFAAIATHDQDLISQLETWLLESRIPRDRYEFQVLYGVPMNGRLEALLNAGHQVRIYVPFGRAWFDYSIRRLKENPKILSYILKNTFKSRAAYE
ncbi:MAG: proline dehydrogenase family protein [Fidelibacterota bacterium]